MSIVERLTARHNGTLQIDSVEGRGTTVTVTLPALQRAATNPATDGKPATTAKAFTKDAVVRRPFSSAA